MKVLVTGSSGHLGEALVRNLRSTGDSPVGLDIKPSPYTDHVGSIADRSFVRSCMTGKDGGSTGRVDAVLHTATLHKPHVATHSRQQFIDTNISGTLNLLEEAAVAGCGAFIYTSTTSTFGDAMKPGDGEPAVWVTEALQARPKNIYGVTKSAAEDLCELFSRDAGLSGLVLKTSRFFLEEDDNKATRGLYANANLKVNELLNRRVDIEDIVQAHRLALRRATSRVGFDKLIITATTPFRPEDVQALTVDAPAVLQARVPEFAEQYRRRSWKMFPAIGRVYDNARARKLLGWQPRHNFAEVIGRLGRDEDYRSSLALQIGVKGYHDRAFADGPYPLQDDF